MYKAVFKNIKNDIQKKEDLILNLWKGSDKKHGIHDKIPHFIFSAENPLHESKLNMTHEETIQFLTDKGYNAESMVGKYGNDERSIIIHTPPKNSHKHLLKLASAMGQDSAIISDGYNHEMHYTNGPKAGKHHKGASTVFHKEPPSDYFSTLEDGTHFTHAFDTEKTHIDSDFVKNTDKNIKKSELFIRNGTFKLRKAEKKSHPLDSAGAGTKLIHYSPESGLDEIHPDHHGVRKIGAEVKQGAPKHKMSFHYAEGVEPEEIVTSGATTKYVSDLGDKKLYDVGNDHLGLREAAAKKAQEKQDAYTKSKGWAGKSMVNSQEIMEEYHEAIKNSGFHGIYNSSLGKTMSHAIGMFEPMKPDSEHKIHTNDFKETSAKDHHADDASKATTKEFADKEGHHNYEFLHNLKGSLEE